MTGIRNWYGPDLLSLQEEPLKVLDAFFGNFGNYIVSGCKVTANGSKFDISSGIVVLEGSDSEGGPIKATAPFEGATAISLPAYLSLSLNTEEDQYNDGEMKPITYDYKAVMTNVQPPGVYITITDTGAPRFVDMIQDALHRFVTDTEKAVWNAKETTLGSQAKADAALVAAKVYADAINTAVRTAFASADASTLSSAKTYADGLSSALISSAPTTLNTLQKLAVAIGNNPTFSTWVSNQLATKQDTIKNVKIGNFNTFNPATLELAVGETCFFNSYNATGMPTPGGTTIYGWSGLITRVYSTYYRVMAFSQSTSIVSGNIATKIYNDSTGYSWQYLGEEVSNGTSGYIKFPSGLMMQWGEATGLSNTISSDAKTVAFPTNFYTTTGLKIVITGYKSSSGDRLPIPCVISRTISSFAFKSMSMFTSSSGSWNTSDVTFQFIAIGRWK